MFIYFVYLSVCLSVVFVIAFLFYDPFIRIFKRSSYYNTYDEKCFNKCSPVGDIIYFIWISFFKKFVDGHFEDNPKLLFIIMLSIYSVCFFVVLVTFVLVDASQMMATLLE